MTTLKSEYLIRCYGAGATAMTRTFDLLNRTWGEHINTRPLTPNTSDWMTDLTDAMFAATCARNWPTFEACYFAARNAINESSNPKRRPI